MKKFQRPKPRVDIPVDRAKIILSIASATSAALWFIIAHAEAIRKVFRAYCLKQGR